MMTTTIVSLLATRALQYRPNVTPLASRSRVIVPAAERAGALERWLAAQPDEDAAARILARTLAAMEHVQRGDYSALATFLDAGGIRFPLDDAAKKSSDAGIKAELWTHASTSSLITGDGADTPYAYARRAVRANPASEAAWAAVIESLERDNTEFLSDDLETWLVLAGRGEVPVEMVKRVLAGACVVAKEQDWSDSDLAVLERMKTLAAELG
jgi:hypothetical protein